MTQLVYPDLSTVGLIGWCLAFVEDAYHTPRGPYCAWDAWNACEFPHTDALPNVQVPVWFSYYEGGFNFGHVAIWVPGRGVLSSPYKANNTQQWFSSIAECERVLNCRYVGWSEDLVTVKVVEEETVPNSGDVHNAYQIANGRMATDQEVAIYTNKPWSAPDGLLYGKVFVDEQFFKESASHPAPGGKVLEPGNYTVK